MRVIFSHEPPSSRALCGSLRYLSSLDDVRCEVIPQLSKKSQVMDCDIPHLNSASIHKPSHQSNVAMCNLNKLSDSQTGDLTEDMQNPDSSYEEGMTVKDSEHSSVSSSSSEADLSDADRLEVNENRQCPLCNKIFPNPAEYTLHLKKHTDGTKCLVCGKVLSSANSLDRHLLVHSGEKPFECQQCGKAFTTNGNMNRHMKKRKHVNDSTSSLTIKKAKIVPNNNEISNPTPVNVSKVKLYDCDRCTYGFRNLIEVGLKPENFDLISKMDCERRRTCGCKSKETTKSSDGMEQPQVCDTCGDVCLRMSNLLPKASNSALFLCKNCGSGFVSLSQFQLHTLSHEIANKNQIINFDIRNEEDKISFLQKLGLISTKEMNDVKMLDTNKEADSMKQFHNSEDDGTSSGKNIPEKSTKVEERILNSSSNHPNDHRMQSTNVSSVVSLSSKLSRSVTSPMSADCASPVSNIIQAPASPIEGSVISKENVADNDLQCKECGDIFGTKKLQTMHYYQSHLKKSVFPCPQCDYVSKDKSTLTRHMRKHTGEKPYTCTKCLRPFTTETNAKRHIRNKHKIFKMLKKFIECKSSEKSSTDPGTTICHYCRKDFGSPKLLTQHKNAPDCPGKMFICGECPMRFTTKNNCIRHMTFKHKLEKYQAKESMIIDKFRPEDEKKDDHYLQRIEMILDAADNEIDPDNSSVVDLELVPEEENQNCTNHEENLPTVIEPEPEPNDVAIDMSQNSSRLETDTSSAHLAINTVRQRPSSTEVDVSYSMLRLSEETPFSQEQEEALDLSIRPIDLTSKIEKPKQNSEKMHSSISSHLIVPPPAHTSPSTISEHSSHRNLLNFLSSTFPIPMPRPHFRTESENYNIPMQSHIEKELSVFHPVSQLQRQNLSNNTEDSNDSERELCIVEDTPSEVSCENGLISSSTSGKHHPSDSEINDLASVSSVIDTANSHDISKFLNPVSYSKTHSAVSELGSLSLVPKTNISKNSCDNKKKFPCNRCDKSFDTASALKRHMVIHTGQKRHKCSTCGKAFGTKSNCKRHELTHLPKNIQKAKFSSAESQNISDVSNNNTEFLNYDDQIDKYGQNNELPQNSLSCSFGTENIKPTSHMLATFSHLFPKNFSPIQNLECKYCLNSYKNFTDLSNHVKELHPSEYRHDINVFS